MLLTPFMLPGESLGQASGDLDLATKTMKRIVNGPKPEDGDWMAEFDRQYDAAKAERTALYDKQIEAAATARFDSIAKVDSKLIGSTAWVDAHLSTDKWLPYTLRRNADVQTMTALQILRIDPAMASMLVDSAKFAREKAQDEEELRAALQVGNDIRNNNDR